MILLGTATLFAFAAILVLCAIMHFADPKIIIPLFFLLGCLSQNKSFSLYPNSNHDIPVSTVER